MTSVAPPPDGFVLSAMEGYEGLVGPLYSRPAPDGRPTLGFRVSSLHVNGRGSLHGGMLVGIADMAWGKQLAAHGFDDGWATVSLVTQFLSPAPLGAWVEATSELVGHDGDLFTFQGSIRTGETMLMTGSAIYKGFRRRG